MQVNALITKPTAAPLTLDEAKAHLRVEGTQDDTYIGASLFAVVDGVENYIQRQLMQAVYELQMSCWPICESIQLPKGPLVSVASVKYDDPNGIEQILDPSNYEVYSAKVPGFIRFIGEMPPVGDRLDAVRIRYTAGYGLGGDDATAQAAAVPELIKAGIKLQLGHLFENRQDEITGTSVSQLHNGSERILHPYRLYL
jgi:uncharacterized phiE125 gp8 family phage protein